LSFELSDRSIDWLLAQPPCASTGHRLWSLPYARQIWLDAEPCVPGTGFAVPTAHVLCALGEAIERGYKPKQALDAAVASARDLVDFCSTELRGERVFWYSTLPAHSYHVVNATALIAGEVQRVAALSGISELASAADQAVRYVLAEAKDDDGVGAWNYFGRHIPENKANRRNDLLHEAFVTHGLLTYARFGGTYTSDVTPADLQRTLNRFWTTEGIMDFPPSEQNARRRSQPARAIGLAEALFVSCELGPHGSSSFIEELVRVLDTDVIAENRFVYRRAGEDISTYIRTRAHLAVALAAVAAQEHKSV